MDSDEELLDAYDGDSAEEDYYYSDGDSDMGDRVDDDDYVDDAAAAYDYATADDSMFHPEVSFFHSFFPINFHIKVPFFILKLMICAFWLIQ